MQEAFGVRRCKVGAGTGPLLLLRNSIVDRPREYDALLEYDRTS